MIRKILPFILLPSILMLWQPPLAAVAANPAQAISVAVHSIAPAPGTPTNPLMPSYTGCGGVTPPAAGNPAYEQAIIDQTNAYRAANGRPPYKRITPLDNAARYHTIDMAADNYFEHDSYDRTPALVWVCAWSTRVNNYLGNIYGYRGENIAVGQSTPTAAMNAWKGSTDHNAALLSNDFWEIGVGYYQGGAWGHYWAQDFSRQYGPAPNYFWLAPLIINSEAATTDSATVTIYIYGTGTWTEMRLKNDNGSWGSWVPFATTFSWVINTTPGEHTVYAELRNPSATQPASDSIILNSQQIFLPLAVK